LINLKSKLITHEIHSYHQKKDTSYRNRIYYFIHSENTKSFRKKRPLKLQSSYMNRSYKHLFILKKNKIKNHINRKKNGEINLSSSQEDDIRAGS